MPSSALHATTEPPMRIFTPAEEELPNQLIPREIHMMWLPSLGEAPPAIVDNPELWTIMNPEYTVTVWEKEAVDEFVGDEFPKLVDLWRKLSKTVMQADLARLLIMYKLGGVYLDMDLIPSTPLERFFDDPYIYNKLIKLTSILPEEPSKDGCDKRKVRTFLSKEHCMIDSSGVGVANGVILTEPGAGWIMEFVELQKRAYKGYVLDYVGTWALTRFVRSRVSELRDAGVVLLPPHYFLWEGRAVPGPAQDYTVSVHPAVNSWGDPTREHWWIV